jgi:hypothetical protein
MKGTTWLLKRCIEGCLERCLATPAVLPAIWPAVLGVALIAFGVQPGFAGSGEPTYNSGNPGSSQSRVDLAIQILLRVPSGKAEIEKALANWSIDRAENLTQVIKAGEVSRTDAVLTRHYDPETGKETREREITIYINTAQSLTNIVLDLSHEMVHATSRPSFDPYDPNLTRAQYIHSAIDGAGGEVQAVAMECRVAAELSKNFQIPLKRCKAYLDVRSGSDQELVKAEPNVEKIRRDFYRVGKWNNELLQVLGGEASLLPHLSPESPQLYSSTGNAPYPVALLKEYEALTRIACDNSRKRIVSQSASQSSGQAASGRAPAGVETDATSMFLQRRCH